MTAFHPYITFDGRCKEALDFYCTCFDGRITFIQYYDESSASITKDKASQVMHSEFEAGHIHFMACDSSPGQTVHPGTNITMYIGFDQPEQQEKVFKKLSDNGVIHMPIEPTVWGARLGILTDAYGVHWMLVLTD